jgi:hypothetical protein
MAVNGWDELGRHVVAELERLNKTLVTMDEKNDDDHKEIRNDIAGYREKTSSEIAALKVKSGVWGFVAGLFPALAALMWFLLAA